MYRMHVKQFLFPLLLCGIFPAATPGYSQVARPQKTPSESLQFIENRGQVTDQYGKSRTDIDFRIEGDYLNLFVGKGTLHYQWATTIADLEPQQIALYRMDVTLVGANVNAQITKEKKQGFYERYYLPKFGEQGATACAYEKITYKEVYPGIDWVLYVKGNTIEYDFVVHPGGKVSDIRLQYGGATQLQIDKAGRLIATTPMGSVTENTPQSFQADGKPIASRFILQGNILSFSTDPYAGTLVIDPTLSWSTYYGGTNTETIRNGCVSGDKYGNAYLCGTTQSTANIATTGSYQDTVIGATDAFLVKFNGAGVRQWATYYGGAFSENSYGVTCDSTGEIYLSGYTNSTTAIATTGSFQTALNGSADAFLVKFDTAGVRLWATYYGGSGTEQCYGVACDKSNNVYITGQTQSTTDIASIGAYQTTLAGNAEAFLVKFNSSGIRQWATYYGGSALDYGLSVGCDQNKNVFLSGYTRSTTGIASIGSHQATYNGLDEAFLVKFDSTGARQWGTYYGGTSGDRGNSVALDQNNNVYMGGSTTSTASMATTGSFQDVFGGGAGDGFLVKFNGNGIRQWATYYGGTATDEAAWITSDLLGHVYIAGRTASTSGIAATGTWQDTLNGTTDAMLIKFDTSGIRLWATYFGGDISDLGYGVYCNHLSKVFLAGQTTSLNALSTTGSHQASFGGGTTDGFLAVFNDCLLTAPASITGSDTVCRGTIYTYSVPVVTGATSYTWTLPTGWSGTSITNSITVIAGSISDTIRVMANFMCGTSLVTIKRGTLSPLPTINPTGTINICDGDSVIFTASAGTAYQWLQGGTAIAGANGQNYTAFTANIYSVVVTNTIGCMDTSVRDTLIVHPSPIPVISVSGNVLSTGSFASYQWAHNGTPITGANTSSFTVVITSGNYTVTVTDSNGCSGTSAPFDGSTVGVNELTGTENKITVYPNPATDFLDIEATEQVSVTISSMEGRLIGTYDNAKRIDIRRLPTGMYILRITDKDGIPIKTQKIVKHFNW